MAFAPSHGSADGKLLLWSMHGKKLNGPVAMYYNMAIDNGYNAAHFHCCCVGKSLKALQVITDVDEHLRVTAFGETLWHANTPNDADVWLARALEHRLAPIGDGLIAYVSRAVSGTFSVRTKARTLGRKRKRLDRWVADHTAWKNPQGITQVITHKFSPSGKKELT